MKIELPKICQHCLAGDHALCTCPGQDQCCAAPRSLRAFKFIARETHVPGAGVYSNCATVVLAESLEAARAAIHAWGAKQSPPDDTKWVDHAEFYVIEDVKPGDVLLFVML